MLIDSEKLKQDIATVMPSRMEVNLIVDAQSEAVIRCKDCKNRPVYPMAYGAEIGGKWCYWCERLKAWKHDDWFCADGERKDGDGDDGQRV